MIHYNDDVDRLENEARCRSCDLPRGVARNSANFARPDNLPPTIAVWGVATPSRPMGATLAAEMVVST